jgi:NitT/TauT family transport system substrate-binding protein
MIPRRSFLQAAAAATVVPLLPQRELSAQPLTKIRLALNLSTYNNLPIFVAADKGYFSALGLDVSLAGFNGSSVAQLPRLARGDTDIIPVGLGPPFFNQFSEGFNVKLVAAFSKPRAGWNDTTWLVVRQDLWDSKQIRKLADLKGRSVDGVAAGSPLDFLALAAIAAGGLTTADVQFTEKFRDPPNWLAALRNKAVDVQGVPEPMATDLQEQRIAQKLVGMSGVAPWFTDTFVAASNAFVRDHRDALVLFLAGCLRAMADITRANAAWTPELVASAAKWMQIPEETIRKIPGPAFPGDGKIDVAVVAREQEFWHQRGLVNSIVSPSAIVDATMLHDAQASIRRHPAK